MTKYLYPTPLKQWRRAKRKEKHPELVVMVGGEPSVLQQYYRDEGTDHHAVTKGKGRWEDIPLEEGLRP